MHSWTIRAATLGAIAAAALIGAVVGAPAGTVPVSPVAPDAFAGPLDPHAVVRATPRDATPASAARLRQVACATPGARLCFVAAR